MKHLWSILLATPLTLLSGTAIAVENGTAVGGASFGVDGMSHFQLPPPGGVWMFNYTGAYRARRINGPHGEDVLPGGEIDVQYNTTSIKYLPNTGILGSKWTAFEIHPTIVRQSFYDGQTRTTKTGLTDLAINPFGLAWESGNVRFGGGTTFVLPIAKWDPNSPVNVGTHRLSWTPNVYWNWFDPQNRGDVVLHAAYEISRKNNKASVNYTNPTGSPYQSGQVLHFEAAGAYNITPRTTLGASIIGAYQMTDDKIDDPVANRYLQDVLEGNRYKTLSLGLSARHVFADRFPVTFTYTHELVARNKTQGSAVVLRLVFPLSL